MLWLALKANVLFEHKTGITMFHWAPYISHKAEKPVSLPSTVNCIVTENTDYLRTLVRNLVTKGSILQSHPMIVKNMALTSILVNWF